MSQPPAGKGGDIGTSVLQRVLTSPATWGAVIGLLCVALGLFALTRFGPLLASTGGWQLLAERYANSKPLDGTLYRRESLKMGSATRYRGCIDITVSSTGLGLHALWPLHSSHPDLLIPWSDLDTKTTSGGTGAFQVGTSQVVLNELNPRILEDARARGFLRSRP